jgi:hypothetical protein
VAGADGLGGEPFQHQRPRTTREESVRNVTGAALHGEDSGMMHKRLFCYFEIPGRRKGNFPSLPEQ